MGAIVYLEGEAEPRRITSAERGGRVLAIVIEGVASRDAAEAVVGRHLETDAIPLPAGSYYWHQLEGLRVEDEAGAPLGVVAEIFRAGGAEVYRIEGPDGSELLVPAIRDVVRLIDLDEGRMVVRYAAEEVR